MQNASGACSSSDNGSRDPTGSGESKPVVTVPRPWVRPEWLKEGLDADRVARRDAEQRAREERLQLHRDLEQSRQNGDVEQVLTLVALGIFQWGLSLKRFLFDLFDESEDGAFMRKLMCSNPMVKPLDVIEPFTGAADAYDLIEFALSSEKANVFGQKLASLDEKRRAFCDATTKLGAEWDTKQDLEAWDVLDRHRSWLKNEAHQTARYIESLVRLIQAGRLGPSVASTRPPSEPARSSPLPDARPDGVHPPRTIVYRGNEHDCELTKMESDAVAVLLPNVETDIGSLMNRQSGVWREAYVATNQKRNKVSRLLTRVNDKLLNANPPLRIRFSIRKGTNYISREEYLHAEPRGE